MTNTKAVLIDEINLLIDDDWKIGEEIANQTDVWRDEINRRLKKRSIQDLNEILTKARVKE